jgi:IS5 family transposase
MRRFARIDLTGDRIPEETTILAFRRLLKKHELGDQIFETVKVALEAQRLVMKQGTILDATLSAATSSTNNEAEERDPEMHKTPKGKQWDVGTKVPIGGHTASR